MLKRWQEYMHSKPPQAWFFSVTFLLVFNLLLLQATSGIKNQSLVLLHLSMALAIPTTHLLLRFSVEQRREKPVSPQQEVWVGGLSVFAVACSVLSLGVSALGRHAGIAVPDEMRALLLMLFGYLILLALALGYAARHTKAGRWGLTLATAWLTFIVLAGFVLLVTGWPA